MEVKLAEDLKERWMNLTPLRLPFEYKRTNLWFGNLIDGKCHCGEDAKFVLTDKNPHKERVEPDWCHKCFVSKKLPFCSEHEQKMYTRGLDTFSKEYPDKWKELTTCNDPAWGE